MIRKLFISCYLILVLLMFMNVNIGYAAVTGKIAGQIVDSQTKEPLPGVNIHKHKKYQDQITTYKKLSYHFIS
ncbi:MAG: hypothetical protein P8Y99_14445, partial [Calditrichaceae bacterium]